MGARIELRLPSVEQATVDELVGRATDERWAERLFDRDTSLWTDDPDVAANITDRLGWLDAPSHFTLQIPALEGFGDGAIEAGFDSAVVMGMGGSSLAPDVFHRTFGTTEGYLELRVLDSTDPAAVAATVDDLDPLETLWIVASKSGTTTEPLAFQADAWARVAAALDERGEHDQRPGEFFVAISDPGRSIASIPHHDDLRGQFLNPPDIGGRYAALTYVGLVPASLIGLDLDSLLAAGQAMLGLCREPDAALNPGLQLGLVMGGLASAGRDKLTILADEPIASFGAWAEQLIAESTGKHGVGIVPVDSGAAARPGCLRARSGVRGARSRARATASRSVEREALAAAGHPVVRIELDDPIDIAGEMVRWEVATAIAGAVLGIDPFDQPNVEDAKERTRACWRRSAGRRPANRAAIPTRPARASGFASWTTMWKPRGAPAPRPSEPSSRPPTSRSRRSSRPVAASTRGSPRSARPSRPPAARPPRATGRASSTRPASSTRAARRRACSCS